MTSSKDNFRDNIVICTEDIESFKMVSPDLLKYLSKASKAQIKIFFDIISKLIANPSETPGKKFYSLYLLLKASETNPNQEFIQELLARDKLVEYIYFTGKNTDEGLDLSQRGRTLFLKEPTQVEANIGVNFVRLCIETIIFWGKTFGKADATDPMHNFKSRMDRLGNKVKLPQYYLFIGKEYKSKSELASWNFTKAEPEFIPYKPEVSSPIKPVQNTKQEKGVINIKKISYDEQDKQTSDSRINLEKILKTQHSESTIRSPEQLEALEKGLEANLRLEKAESSPAETKFVRGPEMLKKIATFGDSPITNQLLSENIFGSPNTVTKSKEANVLKPSSKILEESYSTDKSASIIVDQLNIMDQVNNSYNKISSQASEEKKPNKDKITFGLRMEEMRTLSEERRAPTVDLKKKSASPSPSPTLGVNMNRSNDELRTPTLSDKISPGRRDASPISGADLKASTVNIRNFFNEREKSPKPDRILSKAWEGNRQTAQAKPPNFETSTQSIQIQQPMANQRRHTVEPQGLAKAEIPKSQPDRSPERDQNLGDLQTEVNILNKQNESFRKENAYLMNEIQKYQEEFKRRVELEKLLTKENSSLKATVTNSNQQIQELNTSLLTLYEDNQKLAMELIQTRKELEVIKGTPNVKVNDFNIRRNTAEKLPYNH